jgi:oligopeptidase A
MAETTQPSSNPLLASRVLPAYSAVKPEHVEPAVRELLAAQRRALVVAEGVATPDLDWLRSLERISVELDRVWGPVWHLNSVVSTPPLRDAFNRCLPLVTEFGSELAQNETLYRHFSALKESVGPAKPVERQLIDNALRDFKLGGVTLTGAPKQRFRDVMQELAARQAKFEQNVMDATDAFEYRETDVSALAGLPQFVLDRAAALAKERGLTGWCLRLDPPTYQTVMAHAESADLREKYYRAWNTRASDQGQNPQWDNGPLIDEILALRHELAQLVGFKTFAEFSLATKMAESPQRVIEFLRDLARRSRAVARGELTTLTEYAGRKLAAWDVPFYAERFRQEKLGLAEEELRPYFALPRVLDGLFKLCGTLFDITVAEAPPPDKWHDSVRFYELKRRDGTLIGSFFTDLYARPNKRGGAWMGGAVSRAKLNGHAQTPVAHLVCNFNAPAGATPSLLTHSDVVTVFHEFGHALHHLLTEVDYPSLAGTNGVAWDAVELPSQFLENFAWRPEMLAEIGRHYETGAPLPSEKIDTLKRSRTFLSGLAMVRQLEFALFDFKLHEEYAPERGSRARGARRGAARGRRVEPPPFNRFAHSFGHVFGALRGGLLQLQVGRGARGRRVAAFEEAGVFDRATAERFRRAVLATGGSRKALDVRRFPRPTAKADALLKQSGIAERPSL